MSNKYFRAALIGACCVSLSACGTDTGPARSSTSTTNGSQQGSTLQLRDGWVKAGPEGGMTAAFGILSNQTGSPVTITSVSSDLGATELHETIMSGGSMQMRQVHSYRVPAHGTFALAPGGNHLMFVKLPRTLRVGDSVRVELTTTSGKVSVTLPVRAFNGAKETYQPASSMTGHHS